VCHAHVIKRDESRNSPSFKFNQVQQFSLNLSADGDTPPILSAAMATSKIKIAARLRPRLPAEIDDDAVQVCHAWDEASSSSSGSGSHISVPNPRDPTQVFKFP